MASRSLLNTYWQFGRKVLAKSIKCNWAIWKSLIVTYSEPKAAAVSHSTWRLSRRSRNHVTHWGHTVEACCYLALAARNVCIDNFCVLKGKTAWSMPQVSGTIVQNLVTRRVRHSLFVRHWTELRFAGGNRENGALFWSEAGGLPVLQNVVTSSEARPGSCCLLTGREWDFFQE